MPDTFFTFAHTEYANTASLKECITWIDYHQGIRTLFVATAPRFMPVMIDKCNIAHHETLESPQLSPSGRYLCYTKQHISLDGRIKKQLLIKDLHHNERPAFVLPSGKHLLFNENDCQALYIQDQLPNQLTGISLENGEVITLWTTQGIITAIALCEHNQQVALCCEKSPRSFIALYHLKTNKTDWIAPGFDIDSTPIWSPSGKHLAFIRHHHSNNAQDPLPGSALPAFSLMLFNCESHSIQTLWDSRRCIITAQSSQEGHRAPCWLNDDELVFCHEGCGWEHVYRLHIRTKHITPLSLGDFLVRDITTCPTTESLYLISNQHQRHHYTLNIVKRQSSIQDTLSTLLDSLLKEAMVFSPQAVGNTGRYVALLRADATHACEIILFDQQAKQLIFPRQCTLEQNSLTPATPLTYIKPSLHTIKASDGKISYGQLFIPSTIGPHPAILYLHDGPCKQSLPGFQPSLEMSFHYTMCQYLAHQGFVVLDLNYRGSGGYNKGFREAKERGWHGASEYFDVLAAGKWLARQPHVDTKQIGIMGKGWGGYLTALGLARDSQLFHAGVDIHGYHHFPRIMRALNQPLTSSTSFTCIEAESATRHIACAKLATEHSPWDRLEDWMSPVLLVHGDNNTQVPFSESQQLHRALSQQGVHVDTLVMPGESHTFIYHTSWETLASNTYAFFKQHLYRQNHY